MNRPIAIEICVGDVDSAVAAEAGGADRVELCDNLAVGGTTPSAGAIAEACRSLRIPVHVLIRPRAGSFVYSDRELAVMRQDIETARALGASGVVLGVLDAWGRVDRHRTAALIATARPLSITFHKAVDETPAPLGTLEELIGLGVERVLTSGGRPSAMEGLETIRAMVDRAAGRIAVMAGGRLTTDQLDALIRGGVPELHLGSAACRAAEGHEPSPWTRTDARLVKAIVDRARGRSGNGGE